jgi:soluble lytic murein transglycosylase-like protein
MGNAQTQHNTANTQRQAMTAIPPIPTVNQEKNVMPAVQVYDALPPALRVTVPSTDRRAPPAMQLSPVRPAAVPHQTAMQRPIVPAQPMQQSRNLPHAAGQPMPRIMAEPSRLPAIIEKARGANTQHTEQETARNPNNGGQTERREPEFSNDGDYDDMIDNITTWFSQDNGPKKRKWTRK